MLNDLQKELDSSIKSMAEKNLIKRLKKQGIQRDDLSNEKFHELLEFELEIIKSDGKKVGAGVAVGIGLSLLTGGLF